ncbi:thioesterase family protein [Neisseriaceae bacterium JH1-16]|nr:thioesterase family protein [Neisseriaceae bacterium JH1-16]
MARLTIPLPEHWLFHTELSVRIGDLNYGGHLGNDALLRLAHEARVRFLQAYGYTELNIEDCGLIMADAAVVFRAEAFQGEHLRFALALGEIGRSGFELIYHVTRTGDDREIARLKTGMVFFDYAARQICRTPPAFVARLAPAHQGMAT